MSYYVLQIYGMTETMILASTKIKGTYKTNVVYGGDGNIFCTKESHFNSRVEMKVK
jgi:hypothetical protein